MRKFFTLKETRNIGNQIGINWQNHDPEQFRIGLEDELEHVTINRTADVTNDDLMITGKIAMAHLNEIPDYYNRLVKMKIVQNKRIRAARVHYAVDASIDSIADPPFTETYQSDFKENRRGNRNLLQTK